MRRILILTFLFISVNGFTQEWNSQTAYWIYIASQQNYEPFISDSKVWKHFQQVFLTGGSGIANYLVNTNYFKGDTILNDTKYRKFYSKQEQPTTEKEYVDYLIREDTLNQKVYVYDPHYKKTALLYDFKLKEGDTFNSYVLSDIYRKIKVVRVDTITLLNKRLKRIIFNDSSTWIEGIGSITGEYVPFAGNLICVRDNDYLLYMDRKFSNCDTIFHQDPWDDIMTVENSDLVLFPIPVVSNSILYVNSDNYGMMKIEIFNIEGRLIEESSFRKDFPIGSLHLKNGIYMYRVFSKNQLIKLEKIVVAKYK